ncbi:carbohydrate ABC transporter permease (plasmid) [Agrobacterium leguminum]|uniref:carbohydrate ABC transporter permease n=1 Tax=Agrobacterium leguminum TaxID=2792015 RepID=UPI00272CB973|nr:carbohydrate ABC transporter permease [Agrobacterium leguminum]WLE00759.1 carbohydrate ABC transporter permease [Agrobacterium leguminum]
MADKSTRAFSRVSRANMVTTVQVVCVAIVALVILSPLIMLFVASLKDDRYQILAEMGSVSAFWVEKPSLNNFFEVLSPSSGLSLGRYMINSTIILAGTVLGTIAISSSLAFVLAWGSIPGRSLILGFFILLYIIPQETILLPLLVIVRSMGLMDGFLAQILPFVANPLFVFLFYQFFTQVPKDLVEAARMDGASFFTIYRSIFLPISTPAIAACAILSGIESWNSYLWPLLVTQTDTARPISIAIAGFLGTDFIQWDKALAASVLMMIPVLVLYVLFQRWFMSSFIGSAVKG